MFIQEMTFQSILSQVNIHPFAEPELHFEKPESALKSA
jgi:hypothetical protein